MSPKNEIARIVAISGQVRVANGEINNIDPTTKSNWSMGIQGRPGGMPFSRFTKLLRLSPAMDPNPNARPRRGQCAYDANPPLQPTLDCTNVTTNATPSPAQNPTTVL